MSLKYLYVNIYIIKFYYVFILIKSKFIPQIIVIIIDSINDNYNFTITSKSNIDLVVNANSTTTIYNIYIYL